jgi:hypothetical protein
MRYSITCTGPAGTKTVTSEGGGTVIIGLAAGDWRIGVEARYNDILAGLGEGNVAVRAGASNAVTIKMTPTGAIGSAIAAASTGLHIVNAKAAEDGAYGIGEPFQYQLIATFGDGGAADISDWVSPGDFSYNFSAAAPAATVSLAPSSSLSGVPCSSVSVTVKTMQERVAWANTQGGAHTLLLYADETMPGVTTANIDNAAITIKSGDESPAGMRTLSLGSAGNIFYVDDTSSVDATLVLGRNITLRGINPNTAPLVHVDSSGELIMEEGSAITGNTNTSSPGGGGVFVQNGTFTMNSGSISGNTVTGTGAALGGGVYMNNGAFSMSGGTISGNTATGVSSFKGGGGVFVDAGATFTMNGGIIGGDTAGEKNTAEQGGGVYVNIGTFSMGGFASVRGNEVTGSTSGGGGVYVGSGTFTMENSASVSGNTASATIGAATGGGVRVVGSTTFTMNGSASVSGNRVTGAGAFGGGVRVDSGATFNMGGSASVSGNTAAGTTIAYGGGVYGGSSGTFSMNGSATISGNRVTGPGTNIGGGVYTIGTFTLTQGTVYGTDWPTPALRNTAGSGAALEVSGGTALGGPLSDTLVTTNSTISY